MACRPQRIPRKRAKAAVVLEGGRGGREAGKSRFVTRDLSADTVSPLGCRTPRLGWGLVFDNLLGIIRVAGRGVPAARGRERLQALDVVDKKALIRTTAGRPSRFAAQSGYYVLYGVSGQWDRAVNGDSGTLTADRGLPRVMLANSNGVRLHRPTWAMPALVPTLHESGLAARTTSRYLPSTY
jgi:hypothetical protein